MSLFKECRRWVTHLPHPLHGRYASLWTKYRRACLTHLAIAIEIRYEGLGSCATYSWNEYYIVLKDSCLSQAVYIWRILERFNIQLTRFASTPLPTNLRLSQRDCPTSGLTGDHMKSVPYTPVVGSLMYAMVATQPNITHAVGVVSRFMHNPGLPHWTTVKNIFGYLVGTKDFGIHFKPNEPST